jgi:EF-hand domain pair
MEDELLALFESIDRNHDGSLAKEELQTAFRTAGLTVSSRKLEQFIDAIDVNHDGVVSFEEWRYVHCARHTVPACSPLICSASHGNDPLTTVFNIKPTKSTIPRLTNKSNHIENFSSSFLLMSIPTLILKTFFPTTPTRLSASARKAIP